MTAPAVRVDEIATALGITRAQAAEQLAACGIEPFPDRSGRLAVLVSDAHRLADAHRQARDEVVCATGDRREDVPEPYASTAEDAARQATAAYLTVTPRPAANAYRCPACQAPSGERCRSPQGQSAGRPHAARRARATEANRRRLDDARQAGRLAYAACLDVLTPAHAHVRTDSARVGAGSTEGHTTE